MVYRIIPGLNKNYDNNYLKITIKDKHICWEEPKDYDIQSVHEQQVLPKMCKEFGNLLSVHLYLGWKIFM